MAKPIIMFSGLKIVIMLEVLIIILCGIRFAAETIVSFILALSIATILSPLVQRMVRQHVPRALAVSILMTIIAMAMVLPLAYLGPALNGSMRTLSQYYDSVMTPLQATEPLLQRVGIDISADRLVHYTDPNAATTLLTNLLTQLSNAMPSIFLLLLTMLFMLFEVPQLPGKLQQMVVRPVEGIAAIQRATDSVSHYLVLKTAINIITGLVTWAMLATLDACFAFVWGLLASMPNYIPNIGSVLAAIPLIAQVLMFNGFYEVLLVLAGYLLINFVFGNILEPCIMGRGLGLSTLVVFLLSVFWGWLLGLAGILLSVSLTAIVRIALEQATGG